VIRDDSPPQPPDAPVGEDRPRRALRDVRRHLQKSGLRLIGYLVVSLVVLKLIPMLKKAFLSLEHASWEWVLAAIVLEVLSELGFVQAWGQIVDPQKLIDPDGRGRRVDDEVAWAQLAGAVVLPGGAWGGVGVGALILHRFGLPGEMIAEREFNLSFLNTAIDAVVMILFGVALATRVLPGEPRLLLTLLPAAVGTVGIAGTLLIAPRASNHADRISAKHPKIAGGLTALASAVGDTKQLLSDRHSWRSLLGALAYLGFDVLVLWIAFVAIHAPIPGFAIVVMAYIVGALGGSIPLPAGVGTIGGIAGMLILYGVPHDSAIAAVLLHQAIGLLVPLTGGAIAYPGLRRRLRPKAAATPQQVVS